jgi:hypothetical protein
MTLRGILALSAYGGSSRVTPGTAVRLACAALVLVVAGCGGSNRDATTPGVHRTAPPLVATTPEPAPTPAASPAPADQVRLIRRWADALRHGHVTEASRLFSLPAVVANPGPRFQLGTRAEIQFFNRTLPCGGRLVDSELRGRYVVATFVLTERPGGLGCGSGVGHKAQTAFLIRQNRIVEWLRVLADEETGGTTG